MQFEGLNFRDIQIGHPNNNTARPDQQLRSIWVIRSREYVLLNRTVTLLLGISNTLDPTFNPLDVIRPYMQDYVLKGKGGLLGYLRHYLQNTLTTALALPDEMSRTLRKIRSGELEVRTPDVENGARRIARALQQFAMAILAVGTALLGHNFEKMNLACWRKAAGGLAGWGLAAGFDVPETRNQTWN